MTRFQMFQPRLTPLVEVFQENVPSDRTLARFPSCFLPPIQSLPLHLRRVHPMLSQHPTGPRRKTLIAACSTATDSRPAKTPLFEMRNVNYRVPYHEDLWIFDDMNFQIDHGEFVIMLGSNGSGKSTAIQLMLGFEKLRKAHFLWNGERIPQKDMVRKCGIVLQNPEKYFLTQSVIDELTIGRELATPAKVRRVLTDVGLTDISLMSDPSMLSGGQIRRLAVADQLMKEPVPLLFILDEPLAGVDWAGRRDILNLLKSLKHRFAVLLVTHEPGEVLPFADRVVELTGRKIVSVHQNIITKAISTRKALNRQRRLQAIEDARLYHLGIMPS